MIRQLRRALILASALALLVAAPRAQDVLDELRREKLAQIAVTDASAAFGRGDYDLAAAEFSRVLSIAPRAVEIYPSLAEAEFRRGNVDGAVSAYRALLAIYPYTYLGHLYREVGLIELRGGRFTDARRDLEEAVTLDRNDWIAYHLLGHAYRRLGDRQAARTAWRRVIALKPGYEPAHEQLRRLGH